MSNIVTDLKSGITKSTALIDSRAFLLCLTFTVYSQAGNLTEILIDVKRLTRLKERLGVIDGSGAVWSMQIRLNKKVSLIE